MRILALVISACALSATVSAQVPDFTPKTPLIGALLHSGLSDERRVGRLIAPPVEVMGWCRLPDWVASGAVRVHSKQGAIHSRIWLLSCSSLRSSL